jgi:hypothetical protein
VSEVVALKIGDIGSERMVLRVERGKGRKSLPSRRRGTATLLSSQLLEVGNGLGGSRRPSPSTRNTRLSRPDLTRGG